MWDTPTFCGRCCRGFSRDIDKAKHVSMSSRHYVCYMCGHRPDFPQAYQLRQHENAKHYLCGLCSTYFRDEEVLEGHKDEVHFYCNWCLEWFRNRYDLDEHDYQEHYRCSICGDLFENGNNKRMVWLYCTMEKRAAMRN